MKPHKIEIYLYAENEDEAKEAQKAAFDFVNDNYNRGTLVTARKFADTLRKYKNNIFVTNYLKS